MPVTPNDTAQQTVTVGDIGEGAANPNQPATQGSQPPVNTWPGVNGGAATAGGLYQGDAASASAKQGIVDARNQVLSVNTEIQNAQKVVADAQSKLSNDPATQIALTNATNTLDALYSKQSTAIAAVANANQTYVDAVQKAAVTPADVASANASVDKAKQDIATAQAQVDVLQKNAGAQRDVYEAQAAQGYASANAEQANADATQATIRGDTPAAKQALGEAQLANQQAQSIAQLLPAQIAKAQEEVKTQAATTDQVQSQATLNTASAASATADARLRSVTADQIQANLAAGAPAAGVALTTAQAGQAQGAGLASTAQALGTISTIQQAQLGPLYGLAEKQQAMKQAIGGIAQQVFGPGGSGNVDEANHLLQQVSDAFDASMAGTTPYAANVAAANYNLQGFGTQASLANAAQAALATRASTLGQLGGTALTSLLGVMKDAPKGSQALGPAFADVMNFLTNKLTTGPLAVQPAPATPAMPPLLARLAGVGGGTGAPQGMNTQQWQGAIPAPNAAQGGGGGAAVATAPPPMSNPPGPSTQTVPPQTPNPQQLPMPSVPPPGAPTGPNLNPSAPVTININSSAPQNPGSSGISYSGAPSMGPWPMSTWPGQGGSPMPGVLAPHLPATSASVQNTWGKELASGQVRLPGAGAATPQGSPVAQGGDTGAAPVPQPTVPTVADVRGGEPIYPNNVPSVSDVQNGIPILPTPNVGSIGSAIGNPLGPSPYT